MQTYVAAPKLCITKPTVDVIRFGKTKVIEVYYPRIKFWRKGGSPPYICINKNIIYRFKNCGILHYIQTAQRRAYIISLLKHEGIL